MTLGMQPVFDESVGDVFILAGAGSSVHLGLPTLDDLLKRAALGNDDIAERIRLTKNSIEAAPKRYKSAVFEELISRIKDYIRIARTLRTDNTFRRELSGLPHEIENGIAEGKWKKALTKCYRVLLEEYGPSRIYPGSVESKLTLRLFKELAKLNKGNLHVFTTNYDCSYQVLASNCKDLSFLTHIGKNGRFKEDSWYLYNKEVDPSQYPSIYIHRLHGCIAWFAAFAQDADSGESLGVIEEVYGAGNNLEIKDDDYLNNMCIKLIASQLTGTNPVFASAFEELAQHLKKAKVLLVWGYSFRDIEVMRQIDNAFSNRIEPLQIYYLDPFLKKETVINNIRKTFHSIPVSVAPDLDYKQIDWCPNDGYDKLISVVLATVKGGLNKCKKKKVIRLQSKTT